MPTTISRPPIHPWKKTHYQHIADTPKFDTHFLDALGTFAGNLQKALTNMGATYTKALTNNPTQQNRRSQEDTSDMRPQLRADTIIRLMDVDAEAQFRYPDASSEEAWAHRECFVDGAKWATSTIARENQ